MNGEKTNHNPPNRMMNTEHNTRDLVYLAGLLYDERVQKIETITQLTGSTEKGTGTWLFLLLKLATAYATGTPDESTQIQKLTTQRLQSIFPNLYEGTTKSEARPYYFRMQPVTLDRSFFPGQIPSQVDWQESDTLWQMLTGELVASAARSTTHLADCWLNSLEKYAVTIPANVPHLPDISLYDHLKSTAAIALCEV